MSAARTDRVAATLRREWRTLAACVAVAVAVAVVATVVRDRKWTSSASFTPQASRRQSLGGGAGLGGLASQLGVALPGAEPNASPQFYADLLKSRSLLARLERARFAYVDAAGTPARTTLAEALEIDEEEEPRRREETIREFAKLVSVAVSPRTGVVSATVALPDPGLAQVVLDSMLTELSAFNLNTRRTQARAEREFAEKRVGEAKRSLMQAEQRLLAFQEQNRTFRTSPDLTLQSERLQREVLLANQVYSTLVQLLEQSRIEEVRDTPVLTILDEPSRAARPEPRGLVRNALWGMLLGLVVGGGVLLARLRRDA